MNLRRVICEVAALFLTGCASLNVQVDVLDPNYAHRVVGDGALQLIYFDLQRNGASGASQPVRSASKEIADAAFKLATAYEQLAKVQPESKAVLEGSAADLRTSVTAADGTVKKREIEVGTALDRVGATALEAAARLNWKYDQPMPSDLRTALEKIVQLRREFASSSTREVVAMQTDARWVEQLLRRRAIPTPAPATPTAKAAETAKEAGDALTKVVNVTFKTITGGGTLESSEYAYVVSRAPDASWSPAFNRAATKGLFGNADFVLKMNAQGDFTVKGMRFDASTVAAVAAKVTTQALLVGSQIAGVPVTTSGASGAAGDGKQLADASSQLAANDETVARRKAALDAWKQAVREMASALLAEDAALTRAAPKWSTEKNKVIAPITTTFEALEPVLRLDGVQ